MIITQDDIIAELVRTVDKLWARVLTLENKAKQSQSAHEKNSNKLERLQTLVLTGEHPDKAELTAAAWKSRRLERKRVKEITEKHCGAT